MCGRPLYPCSFLAFSPAGLACHCVCARACVRVRVCARVRARVRVRVCAWMCCPQALLTIVIIKIFAEGMILNLTIGMILDNFR